MKNTFLLLLVLALNISFTYERIINCAKSSCNVCSGWDCKCASGYRWCDKHYDHHCCCNEQEPSTENCVEVDSCHYVCCTWPQKPCGYKCCDPETKKVLSDEAPTGTLNLTHSENGKSVNATKRNMYPFQCYAAPIAWGPWCNAPVGIAGGTKVTIEVEPEGDTSLTW